MRQFKYPNYLRAYRERWALTQRQLGTLLGGISASRISRYEDHTDIPPLKALIGCEFVFGEPARHLFPGIYATVERTVAERAQALAETLAGQEDARSLAQRELLEEIALRIAGDQSHI